MKDRRERLEQGSKTIELKSIIIIIIIGSSSSSSSSSSIQMN
jgi:hypothetical protein